MNFSKKNYLKTLLLFFGASLLLVNCEKEDTIENTISSQEESKISIKRVDLKYIQQKETLGKKIQGIVGAFDINKNFQKSGITANDGSFTILTDEILEVTTDSTEAYTFRIETPTDSTSAFENFIIEKINDDYRYWIYRFIKSTETDEVISYKVHKQPVNEDQINIADFQSFLKTMYYDPVTGCLWETFAGSDWSRNDGYRIFWCPESDSGGGPGDTGTTDGTDSNTDTGTPDDSKDYDSNQDPDIDGNIGGGTGGTGTNTDTTDPIDTDPIDADPDYDPNSPIGVLPVQILFDESFDNKPCQKEIIFLSYQNNSDLANTITSAFNSFNSGNINLTFKASDLDYNGQVGSTNPVVELLSSPVVSDPELKKYNINITFDTDFLAQATDLAIAATAIHEQEHAFLVYLNQTGVLQVINSLTPIPTYTELIQAFALFQENNDEDALGSSQHQYMTNLVNEMTDDLFAFAQLRELTDVTEDYCKLLMWGKLSETKTFENKFPEFLPDSNIPNPEHLAIVNATNAEAKNKTIPFDHPNGNDYTATPKGTPCI